MATQHEIEMALNLVDRGARVAVTAGELDNGDISQAEFDQVTRARQLKRNVIMVDDFDMMLSQHDEKLLERHVF